MRSSPDIRSLLSKCLPGHSLPQPFYVDSDIYEADLKAVWSVEWIFAGTRPELKKTGSYLTIQAGPTSVIVVRGADDTIRAFYNTCRHRGSRICAEARGQTTKLVCPYHQWTYDLDGRLLWTRGMDPEFTADDHGLRPVHVREVSGLIFICLAQQPPDTDLLERTASRYLGPHDLPNLKVAQQTSIVENADWKLVMENNRECYHCTSNHPSLCVTLPDDPFLWGGGPSAGSAIGRAHIDRCEAAGLPSAYTIAPSEQWRFVRIPFVGSATSFTLDGKAGVAKRVGIVPFDDAGSCLFFHYPNTWMHFLSDQVMTFRIAPLGLGTTELTTTWLVHKDAEEGVDYDLGRLTEVWTNTNDEDRRIVEENQVGIRSAGYVPGPYSHDHEGGVIQFIDWYRRTLDSHLDDHMLHAAE